MTVAAGDRYLEAAESRESSKDQRNQRDCLQRPTARTASHGGNIHRLLHAVAAFPATLCRPCTPSLCARRTCARRKGRIVQPTPTPRALLVPRPLSSRVEPAAWTWGRNTATSTGSCAFQEVPRRARTGSFDASVDAIGHRSRAADGSRQQGVTRRADGGTRSSGEARGVDAREGGGRMAMRQGFGWNAGTSTKVWGSMCRAVLTLFTQSYIHMRKSRSRDRCES